MRPVPLLVVLSLAAAAATAAAAPAATVEEKAPEPLKPVPEGGLYLGVGGGLSPDTDNAGYLTGSLVIDRQLFWRVGAWISGEWAYIWRAPEPDFSLRLCFGARIDVVRSESKKWKVIADVAFAHQHEASQTVWRDHPFSSLIGESKDGLGHRSGVEAGGGLLLTPWVDSRNWAARRTRLLFRVSAQWMPDDSGPHFFLAAYTSIGLAL